MCFFCSKVNPKLSPLLNTFFLVSKLKTNYIYNAFSEVISKNIVYPSSLSKLLDKWPPALTYVKLNL